ncbi:MAG: hypothetical protein HY761_09965 [Candidatus Omnitrophica bacterium]|nr:hypothetical protein [Candidatus Omnitrophota bacterium]
MKDPNKHKLTHEEQYYVKLWLAEDCGYSEVLSRLKEQFNKEVIPCALTYYTHHYKEEIQKIRHEINSNILNIPIANKEVRLRRREEIYKIYKSKGELEKARAVLDEAKEEMEPKQTGVHVGVRVDNSDRPRRSEECLNRVIEVLERR